MSLLKKELQWGPEAARSGRLNGACSITSSGTLVPLFKMYEVHLGQRREDVETWENHAALLFLTALRSEHSNFMPPSESI